MPRSGLNTAPLVAAAAGVALFTAARPWPTPAAEAWVELTWPQSDDQGHCVAPTDGKLARLWHGLAASPAGVRRVSVNGQAARLQPDDRSPLTAPQPATAVRFSVTLRQPAESAVVVVETECGAYPSVHFRRDTAATLERLRDRVPEQPR